jgi:hypothetical protein
MRFPKKKGKGIDDNSDNLLEELSNLIGVSTLIFTISFSFTENREFSIKIWSVGIYF